MQQNTSSTHSNHGEQSLIDSEDQSCYVLDRWNVAFYCIFRGKEMVAERLATFYGGKALCFGQ